MAALVLSVPAGTPLELQASADSLRLGWLTGCSPAPSPPAASGPHGRRNNGSAGSAKTAGSTPCSTSSTTPTPRCARWLATTA
ncbi:hypothetical protein P4124_20565 [Pseudomonas aeruginosa]|nr:hypothetical protein [Pseudomonas aeruginosa]